VTDRLTPKPSGHLIGGKATAARPMTDQVTPRGPFGRLLAATATGAAQ
jgi:hypothetical protein